MSWCQSGSAALRAGRSPHLLSGEFFSSAVQSPWVRGGFCGWHKAKASVPPVRQHGRIKGRSLCAGSPGVGRYRSGRSGVSDLSVPSDLPPGGLHSDPLAGLCTLFRLPRSMGQTARSSILFSAGFVPVQDVSTFISIPQAFPHCKGDFASPPECILPRPTQKLPAPEPSPQRREPSSLLPGYFPAYLFTQYSLLARRILYPSTGAS